MRIMKWVGLAAALTLAVACFLPWVIIESRNITVTGIDATGTAFGKPGYFHFFSIVFFLLFNFIPRVWAKRANLFIVALNLAWAIRNYFLISTCQMGECPEKQTAFYMLIPASVLMLAAALFPDIREQKKNKAVVN